MIHTRRVWPFASRAVTANIHSSRAGCIGAPVEPVAPVVVCRCVGARLSSGSLDGSVSGVRMSASKVGVGVWPAGTVGGST